MKWTVQLSNLEKDMTIKKFQIIVCAASLTLAGAANAQVFTGVLGIQEGSPQKSSFTSTSLALDSTNLILSASGLFATQVPMLSDLTAYSSVISGLSSSPMNDPITGFFTFSAPDTLVNSGTTPVDRFVFNLATITEAAYNSSQNADFSGTGTLVDTQGIYANTPAEFNLSFSGPSTYSFTLQAVPEPATISLVATGLLATLAFRRRKT